MKYGLYDQVPLPGTVLTFVAGYHIISKLYINIVK
jgi:hypothetical protein